MPSPEVDATGLFALYRRYLGEPAGRTDVYVGFGLFFGGIAIGGLGLVVFLASASVPVDGSLYWALREVAIVLAALGLPAFVTSVVVLLPVDARAVYASLGGVALCLGGVGLLVATYPQAWNVAGRDYSPYGISLYAGGLTVLAGSAGAALVAHQLERVRPADGADAVEGAPGGEELGDEAVARDIEEAVAGSELTWGGVEPARERRLELTRETDVDLDPTGFDVAPSATSAPGVDDAVAGLRKMQGWEPKAETGSGTGEQAAALRALRERETAADDEPGWVRRVVDRLRDG